jgi:hypothetical protein
LIELRGGPIVLVLVYRLFQVGLNSGTLSGSTSISSRWAADGRFGVFVFRAGTKQAQSTATATANKILTARNIKGDAIATILFVDRALVDGKKVSIG